MDIHSFIKRMKRRKRIDPEAPSKLVRVIGLYDMLAIGVGGTLGMGIYVQPGEVARRYAGPAVMLSVTIAALVSFIACACFAEFAVRIPRVGSAYLYSYVTLGEFVAFIIGWTLIIENAISVASLSRGLSTHIDNLTGGAISYGLSKWLPMNIPFMAAFPDILAFIVLIILHAILLAGVKQPALLLAVITAFNLAIVTIVMFLCFVHARPRNWSLPVPSPSEYVELRRVIPEDPGPGSGGFFPFGARGVVQGAAEAFFGFVGINNIAFLSEEARDPEGDIPRAILIASVIISVAYLGMCMGLTMMLPYYKLDPVAPYLSAMQDLGLHGWRWVVACGAILSITASLFSSVIGWPRLIYAVAHDGMLFAVLKRVSKKARVPYVAIIACSVLSGTMALFFDVDQLINLTSLLVLMSHTVIAMCVIFVRYRSETASVLSFSDLAQITCGSFWTQIFNIKKEPVPTKASYIVVKLTTTVFVVCCFLMHIWVSYAWNRCTNSSSRSGSGAHIGACVSTTLFLFAVLALLTIPIWCQPENDIGHGYKVPLVPFIPCLSIFCNIYLICYVITTVWAELLILAVTGYVFYFTYGMRKSKLDRAQLAASSSSIIFLPIQS